MTPLPWHEVELAIQNEERWLREVFDFGPYKKSDSETMPVCLSNDKLLRQIAIAIVNGTIQASEIKSINELGLWSDQQVYIDTSAENEERHGSHWHQTMMSIVKHHFIEDGFEVINEPFLSQGRADLGVYKSDYQDIFIEIGTTSLFKTWLNLKTMPNTIFLFIPTTSYAIELISSDCAQYGN